MKIKGLPQRVRPRERLLSDGPQALSDGDLLAILLRTGTKEQNAIELAQEILLKGKTLQGLSRLSLEEWREIPGLGDAKIATVLAALEIGRRIFREVPENGKVVLRNAEDVYRYIRGNFFYEERECLWVLGINSKGEPVVEYKVGAGTLDRAPAHPREVFRPLIRANAHRGILCHNHVSGDPTPSGEDIRLTQRMVEIGTLVGIPIVDHIIVGKGGYVSLAEKGYISFSR
jgi:DNA repair protein RadC